MPRPAAPVPMLVTLAAMAGVLAGPCAAETRSELDAVLTQCVRVGETLLANDLVNALALVPGLTRLDPAMLERGTSYGRRLRMAGAFNEALQSLVALPHMDPVMLVQSVYATRENLATADFTGPFNLSMGGGMAAYVTEDDTLVLVERIITRGRGGQRTMRCHIIAPAGVTSPTLSVPDGALVVEADSLTVDGMVVSAARGRIPRLGDTDGPGPQFSMVSMPIRAGSPVGNFSSLGGVTIFRHSILNRSTE